MLAQTDTLFAQEVLTGLLSTPKRLPSKYFYDEQGDQLFQQIMAMPEYYLTNSEAEIFDLHKQEIFKLLQGTPIDLIELGAGDGSKTKILLQHFAQNKLQFKYFPIDISEHILLELKADLDEELPHLEVVPLIGEYQQQLAQVAENKNSKKVLLFLGANIGNLEREGAQEFLLDIGKNLNTGDLMIIGFDLKKDPQTILDAYNDSSGITASFNLNLLNRINRELDADFNVDNFKHWESYNPITGETKSHLVSRKRHQVYLKATDTTVQFDQWEAVYTELSLKYSQREIATLAQKTGFEVVQNFMDSRAYFTDSVWQKR